MARGSEGSDLASALELGQRLLNAESYDKAVHCHQIILGVHPTDLQALYGLALSHTGTECLSRAEETYRRALILSPGEAESYFRFGNFCRHFEHPEAETILRHGRTVAPDNPNLAVVLAMVLLQKGQWQEGWELYELRRANREFHENMSTAKSGHPWNGDLSDIKSLLVIGEQGAGDNIQFIRFAGMLADRGIDVTVRCKKDLEPLLETTTGISEIATKRPKGFDASCLIMSLPHLLKIRPDTIPANIPYIHPTNPPLSLLPGQKPKVGLVWQGNADNTRDKYRSCRLEDLEPLLTVSGVDFFSLQRDWRPNGPEEGDTRLFPLGPVMESFNDGATLIEQLDLLISVDTAMAHLAGALGKPVWLMLGHSPDWRWLQSREDTPWYPSMRIFRTAPRETWADTIGGVAKSLRNHLPEF